MHPGTLRTADNAPSTSGLPGDVATGLPGATVDGRPRSARITGWGMYAPETVLTNAFLGTLVDTSDEWIRSRTGIGERRVAAPWESTATLAGIAGKRAIAVAGLEPDEIDFVIVATCTPDTTIPSTAAFVSEALGTRRAGAVDMNAACSGFVYAYATAHAYVMSGMYRHVLVIGAEVMTRVLDFTDRNTCVLFGDGAGAVVVSASDEPGGGLLGVDLTADPSGAYLLWVPASGTRSPASATTLERGGHFLRMDGRETYRYATRTLAATGRTALGRAGLTSADVSLFVPHQANLRIIESVAKQLGIPDDRIFLDLARYGNTSGASLPIALAEAVDSGRVQPGDRLEFIAFGAGYTSGAAVIEWTADPADGRRAAGVVPVVSIHQPSDKDWPALDPTPSALRPLFAGRSTPTPATPAVTHTAE
jgi:3-oxoacyl-[acyl-carrier-protein] synthase III